MKNRWTLEEKETLTHVLKFGWDFEFPGWGWVASYLESRTDEACRKMAKKMKI